ncbi:TPA: YfcC family protein [Streptococcus suis]|uniref:C4-dicarboxylate anaerobic carrier protein n=1 Tax=Streptococcus suis TaxID=1307 RepID=A0A0Z8MWT8_STRSU|nr:YfcC family protein [Streptococcus suis]NQG66299.1 YfcC family protein [Streptococcus suis]NQG68344.1 YfcC family protein [Streptococcus suis]CYW16681.1 C4-dicarboxylate anaerobic carrier protein [Streptococcus suis]CYW22480.1 C4-dicarboxylate anaerobic carrier protein [Streptococcus suis]HEM4882507.1 YfcC family protein [Streptococcus suis]
MSEKVKKGFKLPSSYTILMLIIAFMAVMTWIIPAGQYQVDEAGRLVAGTYEKVTQNPQGIYDVFMAPVRAMLGHGATEAAINVAFFIIMVGAFLGVVNETGALDVGIASIVKRFKGREKMLIYILMPLFALGGSTYGMGEETMAFFPLLVPVMMAVGFDSITGVAIILLGSQIGCLASTVNPFATVVASDAAGVSVADGMIWRWVFFVVILLMGVLFVANYAEKVKNDPTKSLVYKQREADMQHFNVTATQEVNAELSPAQKRVLWVFVLTFVLMICSFIPWEDLGVTIFTQFKDWLIGLPFIGQVIGSSTAALGTWYFPEGAMLFGIAGIVVGLVYGMSEERLVKSFMFGAADIFSVALICAIARGIQVIMNDGMITATILHMGEEGLQGLSSQVFIILTYLFYLPMSFLIPSSSGLAGASMGIMAPLGEFVNVPASLVITAFQAASGLLNLVAPTSGIVMGALALGRVEIGTWYKFVGKLIVGIMIASIAILVIATFF